MNESLISEAAAVIRNARSTIAVTGAGMSVPSGIPDFRSPKSGLWAKHDPMKVAQIDAFMQHPDEYYDWMRIRLEAFANAEPNPAHLALAKLFERQKLSAIITQNIDGLHERAGGGPIYAVHGQARRAHCLECGKEFETMSLVPTIAAGKVPYCECGGLIKPDIVLFGEALPADVMMSAEQAAQQADVCIVAGTGLEVYPAAAIPGIVLMNRGKMIIINKTPVSIEGATNLVFREDIAEVLPAIVDRV